MKKIFLATLLLILLSTTKVFAITIIDNFDDNTINSALWDTLYYGQHGSETSILEQNTRLEFLSDGWTGDHNARDGVAGLLSKWEVSFTSDFTFQADFHYDYLFNSATGTNGDDEADIDIGIVTDTDFLAHIEAGNDAEQYNNFINKNLYYAEIADPTGEVIASTDDNGDDDDIRSAIDGRLIMSYDSFTDVLLLQALKDIDTASPQIDFSVRYSGLQAYNYSHPRILLGGWSGGAELESGNAYLDNFEYNSSKNNNSTVPEPITLALFGIGLTGMALKKNK